ncbi:cell division protein ZapA [Thiothrix subterranea]|uniref:Cell division protein ZapA n=1 Tax=Thiothrix subterranea TaxID=2735563 RepID=A0AA51MJX3_9GAMM|nr:cell division protein ZapA [Thiothrix subterranea]MDQ5768005.1 cell division protein ZapA [Thiothrix subterranea]QQZ30525.1 cell division protein ZapA [Thiothrix subterranea]WML85230.1 cell division protein ZapA [Thiothrix subterranea]
MEKAIQPVNIRILDKDYMVACPVGEQDALIASSRRVDREMRKIRDSGKVLGSDRIAVMVALNLAHELMHGKHHHNAAADPATLEHLQKMQQRLDATLDKHKA